MSLPQTGLRLPGPTGKKKNCTSWAEYETPRSSRTADLCNGGWYEGNSYAECESKRDCMAATIAERAAADGRRHLPVHTNEAKPFGRGSELLGSTPNMSDRLRSMGWGPNWTPSMPTTIPRAEQQQQSFKPQMAVPSPMQVPAALPYPVQPPVDWPIAMQTPYAGPLHNMPGITPTFLPAEGENVFARLAKNIAQGWIGSTGWHTFDYARTVDLFGRK